jgi:hypothetical protein
MASLHSEAPKSALRPAEGRPEGLFWFCSDSRLANIQPGTPIYSPEALLHDMD